MTDTDTEDYLDVDTEIPHQRYVVLSFISPENVLMKKELYFQSEFLKSDSRKIIVAYKIQGRLNAIIKEIESRGESKYFFVRHARSLIWALAIQALFNDKQISSLLENYGRGLTVEADFTFLLKDIGSKKIRIILSELIKQKKYKTNFDSNKFSFLKSKGAFIDCMAIAEEKYGWESVYLTK